MELRPYQSDLLRRAHASLSKHKSTVLRLETGAGKTVIAGAITQSLARAAEKSTVALYLVHRTELVEQVTATLKEFGLGDQYGLIWANAPESRWKPLQVATVQTLHARRHNCSWLNPQVVFVDEAHHVRAKTWEEVLELFPFSYRLGLTATPARKDGKGLGKYFNDLVEGPSMRDLIADGYLSDFDMFGPPSGINLRDVRENKEHTEYMQKGLDEATSSTVILNGVENWTRLASDRRTIHYAVSVRHSMEFVSRLRALGVEAAHVDGGTDDRERKNILKRFALGMTQVVSNVDILTEGFDAPECDCVVLGRPTKSYTLYKQMVGRVLRKNPNKPPGHKAMIIDLGQCIAEHGSPIDEMEWSLEDGWTRPQGSGKARRTKRCPECDHVHYTRESSCPFCGHVPSGPALPDEIDMQAEFIPQDAPPRKPREKPKLPRKQLSRLIIDTLGDTDLLKQLTREHGYNPGAVKQWKKIYRKQWAAEARRREEANGL